jgi:hypothetical protein
MRALEDGLIALIEQTRAESNGATFTEADFPDLPLTVERMHARECFAKQAASLVRLVAGGSRAASAYAWHSAMHLLVAFDGRVGLQGACDLLCEALRNQVGNRPWSPQLPTVDTVPGALLKAILAPGVWARGELVTTPSAADVARLKVLLDPSRWNRVAAAAVEGLSEVKSETVVRALRGAGLIGAHPNTQESARVSATLEALGFVKSEITVKGTNGKKGQRYRAWLRPAPPATVAPEVDVNSEVGACA